MATTLYYAVNGSGQGVVFVSHPIRDEKRKIWLGRMVGVYSRLVMQMESEGMVTLPALKWPDAPVRLEISLEVCSEERH